MPRKQRHTARRVYDRLVAEQGFDGSYPIVQRYVKRWRQEHRVPGEGYLELEWSPGVMQVDFGLAQAVIAGNRTDVHCLVVSFPHSNMRYAVALPGENAECVCEGLRVVFEHAGVAPLVMVFDNATGAGHRVAWDGITVVDPNIEGADKLRVLSFGSRFARTIERMGVQEVYIADVLSRDSKLLHAMSLAIESLGIELAISVSLADVGGHRLHLRNSAEQQVLIASLPQYRTTTYVIKRIIDIVLSAVALVVSSPIMLGVAIAIKLDDGGPVLFKQTRVGIHGKPFTMYKFRSMVTNAEEIKAKLAAESGQTDRFIFKLKDDPRITKVGKFIRKTSLDEFPQFFNVFKGDMSLVGPRPALPDEVARYGSLYSTRLLVKPGITGPWQVSGRSDLSQEQSEFLDVSYIENWSITGDLAILAKTVMVVFRGTGSY